MEQTPTPGNNTRMLEVSISDLRPSGFNNRKQFDQLELSEMASTMKTGGVLQPLITIAQEDGTFTVIAGNRRWKAAELAGLSRVPVVAHYDVTPARAREMMLIENIQRRDVHPLEEVEVYTFLSTESPDLETLAQRVGKTPQHVARRLRLGTLIPEIVELWHSGRINLEIAEELCRLNSDQQADLVQAIADYRAWNNPDALYPIKDLRSYIQRKFFLVLKNAPFALEDETYSGGACTVCPKRTGASPLLFADIRDEDTCTDSDCYAVKCGEHVSRQVAANPNLVRISPLHQMASQGTSTKNKKKGDGASADVPVVLYPGQYTLLKSKDKKQPGEGKGIYVEGPEIGKIVRIQVIQASADVSPRKQALMALTPEQRQDALEQKLTEVRTKEVREQDMHAIPLICAKIGSSHLAEADFLEIAHEVVNMTSHETAKRYCDGEGLNVKAGEYSTDYRAAIQSRASNFVKDARSLARFLFALILYGHVGRTRTEDIPEHHRKHYLSTASRHLIWDAVKRHEIDLTEKMGEVTAKYDVRRDKLREQYGAAPEVKKAPAKKAPVKKAAPAKKGKKK